MTEILEVLYGRNWKQNTEIPKGKKRASDLIEEMGYQVILNKPCGLEGDILLFELRATPEGRDVELSNDEQDVLKNKCAFSIYETKAYDLKQEVNYRD